MVADVTITVLDPYVPYYRGELLFPVGTFRTVLTTAELEMVRLGHQVNEIHRLAAYEKKHLFTEFVAYFYKLKLEYGEAGDRLWYLITKLIMNSFYGKWGQRVSPYREVCDLDDDISFADDWYDMEAKEWVRQMVIRGKVYQAAPKRWAFDAFPTIAAHVTAYGRMVLLRFLIRAGWEHVFYCDTDSLIVDGVGYKYLSRFVDGHALGYLKLEQVAQRLTIQGPKFYQLDNKIVHAGIRTDAQLVEPGRYQQRQAVRSAGMVRRELTEGVWRQQVYKTVRPRYRKGRVQPDGRVVPVVLGEEK